MKSSKYHEKVRHFPILASMLAKRYGVEVIFHGEQPKTDGKRIVLPALPDDLTGEDMMLLTGFLDHEAGAHGQHMDFDAWFSAYNSGIAKEIKNILCDARDEHLLGKDYPGCRENLRNMVDILDNRGLIQFETDNAPSAFLGWLFHKVHASCGHFPQAVKGHPQAVRRFLSDNCLARIDHEVQKAIFETETAGVVARTGNILRILQEEKDNLPSPPKPKGNSNAGDGRGGGEENSGSGGGLAGISETEDGHLSRGECKMKPEDDVEENGHGLKSGGNLGGEAEAGSAAIKCCDVPENHGGRTGCRDYCGSNGENDLDEGGEAYHGDTNMNLNGAKENALDQSQGGHWQPCHSPDWSREHIEEILDTEYGGAGDLGKILLDELEARIGSRGAGPQGCEIPGIANFEKLPAEFNNVESLRQITAQLRGRTLALIQASRYKPAAVTLRGRRLVSRALSRIAVGNMRIFERREPREAVNTAIVILGDCSGSMSGKKAEMAFQGAFIGSEAMKSIPGTATLVAAYPANPGDSADLGILKGWTENTKPVQPAAEGHWSPIAEALQWARVQLAFRRETRKIVLILTDGESSDDERARKAVGDLEADGIELIAMGIQCDSPQRWTSSYRQLDDIKELPVAMIEMLRLQLIENRCFRKSGW
jgi:cobaltochelatase CobT